LGYGGFFVKKILGCIISLTATAAMMAPACAAVVYAGIGSGLGVGPTTTTFDVSTPAAATAALNGIGYTEGNNLTFLGSGNAGNGPNTQVLNGTSGIGAAPFGDSTNYLSVLGTGSVTVNITSPADQVTFYWGSIDKYNSISFVDGGHTYTFDGSVVTPSLSDTGCQTISSCSGLVTFQDTTGGTISSFTLSSSSNSFEADNFTATEVNFQNAVPESSTWMMMLLGFFGVGFAAYRRKGRALQFRLA
jgi:hypothetical protein